MGVFKLPDLGEGLPDAEIVEWLVAEGDEVKVDQPMVSMETAKAVVEVPSPQAGVIAKLHGANGDIIDTGAPLVTFRDAGEADQSDEVEQPSADNEPQEVTESVADHVDPEVTEGQPEDDDSGDEREDSGTVVGAMESSDQVLGPEFSQVGQHKVTPAVRALARKLKVDLDHVTASGANGVITARDVKDYAASPDAVKSSSSTSRSGNKPTPRPAAPSPTPASPPQRDPVAGNDEWSQVKGARRTMARAMAAAHAAVVPTAITEEADMALWEGKQDITVRMIRAMCAGVKREPVLNSWFDGDGPKIKRHSAVHLGIAVDTPDGLFVSRLKDADAKTPAQLRGDLNNLRDNVQNRSIPPEDLTGYTIMLSNVGVYAGQYTTPVITPPCVAILATGKIRDKVVSAHGGIAVHPTMPLSLTFDHRAVTGGEAARFLAAFLEDFALAN